MKKILSVPGLLLLALGWPGCASSSAPEPVYTQAEAGQVIRRQTGEIVAVRDVVITPTPPARRGAAGAGARLGAATAVGAILGSPQVIANAVRAVVRQAGGSHLDNKAGEEIRVQLQGGEIVTVVQERSEPPFAPGEHVEIVLSQNPYQAATSARVVRDDDLAARGQ